MEVSIEKIIQLIGYTFIFIVGIAGNFLVFLYFLLYERKVSANYRLFIIYLAVTDLVSCLITPLFLIITQTDSIIWFGGSAVCTYGGIASASIANASLWIICGLSYIRYQSIAKPLNSTPTKARHVHVFCALIWILSWIISYFKPWKFRMKDGQCKADVPNSLFSILYFSISCIVCGIVPLAIVLVYTCKVRKVMKNSRAFNSSSSDMKRHNDNSSVCKKSEQALNVASVLHVAVTLPVNIYFITVCVLTKYYYSILLTDIDLFIRISMWLWLLYVMNSIVNCCVYAGRNPSFKQYLTSTFSCKRTASAPNDNCIA